MTQSISIEPLATLQAQIDPGALRDLMPITGGVVTMMFTDIVGSTQGKAEIGDRRFLQEVLEPHHALVRACVAARNGRELKTIGDAFLVGFAIPRDAIDCAVEIQRQLAEHPIPLRRSTLQVRIGIHTGTPVVYRDPASALIDLSGTDVDKAARVEALAVGGQVLVSEEARILGKPDAYDWGLWELRGLGRHRVFEVLWPGRTAQRPAGRASAEPVPFLTRFVGREVEISTVMDAVLRHRIVTLRGMGGVGKTRLAYEVAARVGQQFEDGVLLVELAETEDSESAVVAELVSRLKVPTRGHPDDASALQEYLEGRRALLVLDNFEAVASCASLVRRLLRSCPSLHVLVTSQSLLDIEGEQQIEMVPMVVPGDTGAAPPELLAGLDSFQLFQDRARLQQFGWTLPPADAATVAEILALTDGVPLAIELAATSVGRRPLREVRDGLRERRAEHLKRPGAAGEGRRHASIEACVDWSVSRLSGQEQRLFERLSVFANGCFATDAVAVCDEPAAPAVLESLRNRSLLAWEEANGRTRYRMLPTVREIAFTRLRGDAVACSARHAAHFAGVLERANEQLLTKQQRLGLDRIGADLDNIRLGFETAIEARDDRLVVTYAHAIATYLQWSGRFAEALARAQQGGQAAERLGDPEMMARAHNDVGVAYRNLPTGDLATNLARAIAAHEAALAVYDEHASPRLWATVQSNLGIAAAKLPSRDRAANLERAIAYYEASLRVFTETEFPVPWATTQNNLGIAYQDLPTGDRTGNLKNAIACFEATLRVYTETEFPVLWAGAHNNLGIVYQDLPTGSTAETLAHAITCYAAALRVYNEREFPVDWAMTQNNLGTIYQDLPTGERSENLEAAIVCYEHALRVCTEREFPVQWARIQNNLGTVYHELTTGDRDRNLRKGIACYEASLRVRTERQFPVQWAMTQNNLGSAHSALPSGDRAVNLMRAIACYEASLRVRTEAEFPVQWAMTHENLATAYGELPVSAESAPRERAIECWRAAERGYRAGGLTDDADAATRHAEELARR